MCIVRYVCQQYLLKQLTCLTVKRWQAFISSCCDARTDWRLLNLRLAMCAAELRLRELAAACDVWQVAGFRAAAVVQLVRP